MLDRKLGIGGSDCAAVLGMSKFKTPYEVWKEKINGAEKNESIHLEIGNELENYILRKYQQRTGFEVMKPERTFFSKKYPFMMANLDGVVKGKSILFEAKTTGFFDKEEWGSDGDEMPVQYILQCAHYCIVMDDFIDNGVEFVDLEALSLSSRQFRSFRYDRNEELEKRIIDAEGEFWNKYVTAKIEPELTANDNARNIYKDAKEGSIITANNEISEYVCSLKELKKRHKLTEALIKDTENKIIIFMKDNEVLVDIDGTKLVTCKNQVTKRINTDALKQEQSELYKKYLNETKSRVLRISK